MVKENPWLEMHIPKINFKDISIIECVKSVRTEQKMTQLDSKVWKSFNLAKTKSISTIAFT